MDDELVADNQNNWKTRVIVLGGVIGLATGLVAAYLLVQRSEKADEQPALSTGEGIKLGLLVFGLLRQISQLSEGK